MRNDFRVSFGDELVAFALELFFEFEIVFDDAVVDDDDLAAAIAMRMGVFFRGAAVRGPTCVTDAVGTVKRGFLNGLFEVAKFAGCATKLEFSIGTDYGDAGRIVAAIFELAQAFDNNRDNLFWADITHYPAHEESLLNL